MATVNRKTTNVTDLVQPTVEQKHEIYEMLKVAYDCKNKRYTGAETDRSLADELGIKRWAWVQDIREQFFGPDGNEAEFVALAEIQSWILKADKEISEFKAHLKEMETSREGAQKLMDQVQHLIGKKKGS